MISVDVALPQDDYQWLYPEGNKCMKKGRMK